MSLPEASGRFCYDYERPSVATDIVLFTIREGALSVLLIERGEHPFKGSWALPGGFLRMDESPEQCALRELEEETGVEVSYLEQLYSFGAVRRDPRYRVLSIAHFALTPWQDHSLKAATDAADARWFDCHNLPKLAFDHSDIVGLAMQRLAAKLNYSTIALPLLPKEFTLGALQQVYEIISGKPIDKRNFRKQILARKHIEETGKKSKGDAHRPAMLYRAVDVGKVVYEG